MKIVFILVLCLSQALCDPFVLLASKIAARKNPEDDFVGVVKGQPQSTVESTTKSEPEAEHPADKVDATKEVVHTTTTTDKVPPPPPQPATTTTSSTETHTQKTDTTQTSSATAPTTTDQTTTTTTMTTTAKKDESEVPLEGHGNTTVAQPEAEKAAVTEKPKEETTVSKEETTTTKTSTDADVLEKLKNLKERVEKLENEETQKADYGKGSGGGAPSITTSTNNNIVPVSSNYVNTANGPAPKYYDGNGVPHPGQIIGVSPFGVATPLIGVGAADPSNKQKYNSIDVGKALNTDTTEISAGKGVAEQADQAHKDFLDENTEEFERIMSWLQEQQHLLPKQHQPPKLLFQILKERIMIQEQKVLSQMLEKQQVQQQPQQQPQQPPQQPPQLLQQEKFQKLAAFPNLHIVAYDNNNPAPSHGNTNTIIE